MKKIRIKFAALVMGIGLFTIAAGPPGCPDIGQQICEMVCGLVPFECPVDCGNLTPPGE